MKTNPSAPSSINIGILGFGNVGSAVAATLQKNAALITERAGVKIRIKKVCDVKRKEISLPFTANPREIISDPQISIVVETIGGVNPAKKYILSAISAGKHVVTSNKEVIAKHMAEILLAAAKHKVAVLFEGAVGGGIPILHPLREGLAANRISEIYGIVNGTTNYILSRMTEEGTEFSEALEEAKGKGYAEADPRADLEGYDAQYKAAILASVAYGADVDLASVSREGISKITQEDIRYAGEIGYIIKLLAIANLTGGKLDIRVHPALVNKHHPLAAISENFNAIYVKGKPLGEVMFYGPGAGGDPTSSAVVADVIDVVRHKGEISIPRQLKSVPVQNPLEIVSRYYFHLKVPDRSGVLAQISKVFADEKVSIQAVLQKETVGKIATLVIILHAVREKNLRAALSEIRKLPVVSRVCNVIRIVS